MASYTSTSSFHSPATSPVGSYVSTAGSYLEAFEDAEDAVLEAPAEMERSPGREHNDAFKLVTPSKLSSAHKRDVAQVRDEEKGRGTHGKISLRASLEKASNDSLGPATNDAEASPGRVQLRQSNGEVYGVISTHRKFYGATQSTDKASDNFSRFERWRKDSFSRFERYKAGRKGSLGETTSLLPSTVSSAQGGASKNYGRPCCFGSLSRIGCGVVVVMTVALCLFGVFFAVPPMARSQITATSISFVHIDLSKPKSSDDTIFLNIAIDVTNPGLIGGSVSDGALQA